MKIKIKDIELDLPNSVSVEIFEDGKRIVVSQPPDDPTKWINLNAPYNYQDFTGTISIARDTK